MSCTEKANSNSIATATRRPTICGTGLEDYVGSAWGLGRHTAPYAGVPIDVVPPTQQDGLLARSQISSASTVGIFPIRWCFATHSPPPFNRLGRWWWCSWSGVADRFAQQEAHPGRKRLGQRHSRRTFQCLCARRTARRLLRGRVCLLPCTATDAARGHHRRGSRHRPSRLRGLAGMILIRFSSPRPIH